MIEQITYEGTTYDFTANGVTSDVYRIWLEKEGWDPANKPPIEEQVKACAIWLTRHASKRKTINKNGGFGSYSLKHLVEKTTGYVTNGALILAAHRAGYLVVPDGPESPNAHFNISIPGINKLADERPLTRKEMGLKPVADW